MSTNAERSNRTFDILLWKNKVWESRVSNTGDLAIIRNTLLKLRERLPNARLHLVSDDPDYVRERYGAVGHPVSVLFHPIELVKLLRQMDLVILGGGTVLQDNYFVGVIPANLGIPMLAKTLGVPVVACGIGVGSDDELSWLGKIFCRLAVPHFESISVRDRESQEILERWTKASSIRLATDIAVDLPEADFARFAPAVHADIGYDLRESDTVAIAARKVFHHEKSALYFLPSGLRYRMGLRSPFVMKKIDDFKSALAALADHIVDRHGARVLFTPFSSAGGALDSNDQATEKRLFSSGDVEFAEEVASRAKATDRVRILRRSYAAEELLAILGQCKAAVGVPYHSVVFASSRNVPVLGIDYVSKVGRYMRILGLEQYVVSARPDTGVSIEEMKNKFDDLWAKRTEVAAQLRVRNEVLRRLSDDNILGVMEALPAAK